jgi:hypothetical protein
MTTDELFSSIDSITKTVGNVVTTAKGGNAPNKQPAAPAVSSGFTLPANTMLIVGGLLLAVVIFFALRKR